MSNTSKSDKDLLLEAAFLGDLPTVKMLIEKGISPTSCNEDGQTPLLLALRGGKDAWETFLWLLENGATINHTDKQGYTPLFWAVKMKQPEAVRLLLERKADPNVVCELGFSILWYAVRYGQTADVKLLLENGAKPDILLPNGTTPLMTAVELGNLDIVKLLITHGANINQQTVSRRNLLDLAQNPAVQDYLKSLHLQPTNPEKLALANTLTEAALSGNTHLVSQHLAAGADVNLPDSHCRLPALAALKNGHLETAAHLVRAGAEPTPLLLLAVSGPKDLVFPPEAKVEQIEQKLAQRREAEKEYLQLTQLLIQHGADVNATDSKGNTPLMSAAKAGLFTIHREYYNRAEIYWRDEKYPIDKLPIIRTLIQAGADIAARNQEGKTALDLACTDEVKEYLKSLQKTV